jgi:hypothetical protein
MAIAAAQVVGKNGPRWVPQSIEEWMMSVYDPDRFEFQRQMFRRRVALAGAANNTVEIQVPLPYFCFGVRALVWLTANGAAPPFPVDMQIQNMNNQDWSGGQTPGQLLAHDNGPGVASLVEEWKFPRELDKNETLTITFNNALNIGAANAVTCEFYMFGYQVGVRVNPIKRVSAQELEALQQAAG